MKNLKQPWKMDDKILVVDEHQIVITGILEILGDFKNVEYANSGEEALNKISQSSASIVITEAMLPDIPGMMFINKVVSNNPATKVIVYSACSDSGIILDAYVAGAYAYILKSDKASKILEAINKVREGKKFMDGLVSDAFINELNYSLDGINVRKNVGLSVRETQVLIRLCEGNSNQEIADHLNLSIRTIETHKYKLMKKLQISSVAGLVKYALKKKLINL